MVHYSTPLSYNLAFPSSNFNFSAYDLAFSASDLHFLSFRICFLKTTSNFLDFKSDLWSPGFLKINGFLCSACIVSVFHRFCSIRFNFSTFYFASSALITALFWSQFVTSFIGFLQYLQVPISWLELLQEVPFQYLPSHVIWSSSPLQSYCLSQV